MTMKKHNYGTAILSAFEYLLENYPEVFVIGQGLWSPWYVGNSMTDLDKKFGVERVIDTPVSESACTGAAVGASLAGMKPIVVHPRMDFMLYAMDAVVNQASKWSHMSGGQAHPGVTIRCIINRGGEQGAQHSQALHAWFAHVPGLRVVMPSTVADARDLLIASVLCNDPVMYIDDRWLYDQEDELPPVVEFNLTEQRPVVSLTGSDITIVASGHASLLAREAAEQLESEGISVEVVDVRVLNPFYVEEIIKSINKTKNFLVVDSGWLSGGFSAEIVAKVVEQLPVNCLNHPPVRVALPDAPAPTSRILERAYYTSTEEVVKVARKIMSS
ncbi:Acetoin dehydrogenase E1 component beta-subunit (EC 2.3.1.190) [uncultured Gammaproteobacteria bacterium]|nr:Acetoin dehydrogenase E1 component beta-subunit (EC 2.3.1.190) [uncultured Gammaproteobacteria bacterium]CAC9624991.1 Acetoin dehydrogenase E1 component beta-subunit (EC 2.3.1.190) [uncultured Gammaproteobacteria bacterium]CAC9625707.1 Acetoin dehydrogenase E1 component beta-subunit (EC 2.3.1.190) [uncultured Gammaproteobacteria bacterium]